MKDISDLTVFSQNKNTEIPAIVYLVAQHCILFTSTSLC